METKGAVLTKSAKVFEGMFEDKAKIEQSISARIRYCMYKAKVPQYKIAKAIGYAKETIFNYMNGKVSEEHMNVQMLPILLIERRREMGMSGRVCGCGGYTVVVL